MAPKFVANSQFVVDMSGMEDPYDGRGNWWTYGSAYVTLKFGSNGSVTTSYSHNRYGKATATSTAQLVPYDVKGDTICAWIYTVLKPPGSNMFGLLLFLEIDTSNGVVTGDDVEVVDYLLEIDV